MFNKANIFKYCLILLIDVKINFLFYWKILSFTEFADPYTLGYQLSGLLSDDQESRLRWVKHVEQCNPTRDPAHSLEAGMAMPLQRVADYAAVVTDIQVRGGVRRGTVLYEKLGRMYKYS